MVTAPGSGQYHVRERSLQVVIKAEGPTCVLTVADLQVLHCTSLGNFSTCLFVHDHSAGRRAPTLAVCSTAQTLLSCGCAQVHLPLSMTPADCSGSEDLGWEKWSCPMGDKQGALFSSQADNSRAPSALLAEVRLHAFFLGPLQSSATHQVRMKLHANWSFSLQREVNITHPRPQRASEAACTAVPAINSVFRDSIDLCVIVGECRFNWI